MEPTANPSQEPTQTPASQSTPEPTATATQEATPTATTPPSFHVADLDGLGMPGKNSWYTTVTVTVLDDDQTPVGQATIRGLWNGGDLGGAECVTDGSGQCSLTSDKLNSQKYSDLSFTVDSVIHDTLTYEPADNSDPEGDSDGTTIIVNRPS
jgi:hypothetical protein